MIRYSCSNCNKPLRAKNSDVGRKCRCPKCGSVDRIPANSAQTRIDFACPSCDKKYSVELKYAGKRMKCRKCHSVRRVPPYSKVQANEKTHNLKSVPNKESIPCPNCEKSILPAAIICKWCNKCVDPAYEAKLKQVNKIYNPNLLSVDNGPVTHVDSNQALKDASTASAILLFGMILLCCGCPVLLTGLGGSGSSYSPSRGSSYSPSRNSYSSGSTYSSSYSSSSGDLGRSLSNDTASEFADNYDRASASEKREFDRKMEEKLGVSGDDMRHLIRQLEKAGR